MKTKDVLETLIYNIPDLYAPMQILDIINKDRIISVKNHKEIENLIAPIIDYYVKDTVNNKPIIISAYSMTGVTYIVSKEQRRKKHLCVMIYGPDTYIEWKSKSKILEDINAFMNLKDFMPNSFIRKIVYIKDYLINKSGTSSDGIVFSEYSGGYWTIGDPFSCDNDTSIKTTPKIILTNICSEYL